MNFDDGNHNSVDGINSNPDSFKFEFREESIQNYIDYYKELYSGTKNESVISVRLNTEIIDIIEVLVKVGIFNNKSDVLRYFLTKGLEKRKDKINKLNQFLDSIDN
ncbi:type II toxin-antitoxin system ParD family antitoxin [Aerococcaceae bacterium zg-BR9]|uniref:hypothetical protein n=1 Tax=Aerococcaceae bacterium zg-1292 TaxID=2774330 RepID=UPI004063EBF4|nr:type II toxin-antitoxin system ParD family antitoxin [Aerococcaceae bacterium zg-BR9]